jgi:hypothetical protein
MGSSGLLTAAQRHISEYLPELHASGFPVSICYADQRAGTLIAGIPLPGPDIRDHYRRLLRDLVDDTPVRIAAWSLARRHAAKREFNRPLTGGLYITAPEGKERHSEGTICIGATRNGAPGFVTAGHVAAPVGTEFYQPRLSDRNDWRAGKTAKISEFATKANSDSAFLADGTGGQISLKQIWRAKTASYTVTGPADAGLGVEVYMQGNSLVGERQGKIVAVNVSVSFEDGGVLDDQLLASYESREGDSGAPVYVKHDDTHVGLVGLNVGSTLAKDVHPKPPDGEYAVISRWARIAADIGVAL